MSANDGLGRTSPGPNDDEIAEQEDEVGDDSESETPVAKGPSRMSRRMEKLAKPNDGGKNRKTFSLGDDPPPSPQWLNEYDELMVERRGRAKVPSRARPRHGSSPRKQAFLQRLESKGVNEGVEEDWQLGDSEEESDNHDNEIPSFALDKEKNRVRYGAWQEQVKTALREKKERTHDVDLPSPPRIKRMPSPNQVGKKVIDEYAFESGDGRVAEAAVVESKVADSRDSEPAIAPSVEDEERALPREVAASDRLYNLRNRDRHEVVAAKLGKRAQTLAKKRIRGEKKKLGRNAKSSAKSDWLAQAVLLQ